MIDWLNAKGYKHKGTNLKRTQRARCREKAKHTRARSARVVGQKAKTSRGDRLVAIVKRSKGNALGNKRRREAAHTLPRSTRVVGKKNIKRGPSC
jgi:hypothetical protein